MNPFAELLKEPEIFSEANYLTGTHAHGIIALIFALKLP